MRASLLIAGLLSSGATTASVVAEDKAELVRRAALLRPGILEFDHGDVHFQVLPKLAGVLQPKAADGNATTDGGVSPLTARSVVDVLLRRATCRSGYGYCSSFDACCPSSDRCCTYGYCIDPEDTCCPNAPCAPGRGCCGQHHCYPRGDVCCGDESYCPAGNHCYKDPDYTVDVCCTDPSCTAYVSDGVTISYTTTTRRTTRTTPPVTTPPPTATFSASASGSTTTETETFDSTYAYYFTLTYTYYYYYWYTVDITRSVVRSAVTSDRTLVTVSATDAADATSSFRRVSATLTPTPPPEADTSLSSLVGKTTTEGGGTSRTTSSRTTSRTTTSPSSNGGSASGETGAAPGSLLNGSLVLWLWTIAGVVSGILMVVL